jgi:predicted acylesterase/phospholipase RssA
MTDMKRKTIQIGKRSKHSPELSHKHYKGLCLSSGGIRGLLISGALYEFWKRGQLGEVEYFAGSSIGSAIALMMAIGYSPLDTLTSVCLPDFASQFMTINFLNLPKLLGVYPISILRNKLTQMVLLKLGKIPTFLELKNEYNKTLITVTYCISETDPEKRKTYCSLETTPDMNVVEAVILSCSIPLIFEKVIYEDKHYIDGAYTTSFPIEKLQQTCPPETPILGVLLESTSYNTNSFMGMLSAIFTIPLAEQDNLKNVSSTTDVIEITNDKSANIDGTNFNISSKEKTEMFCYAQKQVSNLMQTIQSIESKENVDRII